MIFPLKCVRQHHFTVDEAKFVTTLKSAIKTVWPRHAYECV